MVVFVDEEQEEREREKREREEEGRESKISVRMICHKTLSRVIFYGF